MDPSSTVEPPSIANGSFVSSPTASDASLPTSPSNTIVSHQEIQLQKDCELEQQQTSQVNPNELPTSDAESVASMPTHPPIPSLDPTPETAQPHHSELDESQPLPYVPLWEPDDPIVRFHSRFHLLQRSYSERYKAMYPSIPVEEVNSFNHKRVFAQRLRRPTDEDIRDPFVPRLPALQKKQFSRLPHKRRYARTVKKLELATTKMESLMLKHNVTYEWYKSELNRLAAETDNLLIQAERDDCEIHAEIEKTYSWLLSIVEECSEGKIPAEERFEHPPDVPIASWKEPVDSEYEEEEEGDEEENEESTENGVEEYEEEEEGDEDEYEETTESGDEEAVEDAADTIRGNVQREQQDRAPQSLELPFMPIVNVQPLSIEKETMIGANIRVQFEPIQEEPENQLNEYHLSPFDQMTVQTAANNARFHVEQEKAISEPTLESKERGKSENAENAKKEEKDKVEQEVQEGNEMTGVKVAEESHDKEEYRSDGLLENDFNALSDVHQIQFGNLLSQPLDNILRMAEFADSRRGDIGLDDTIEKEECVPIEENDNQLQDINFDLEGLLPPEPVEYGMESCLQHLQQPMEVPYPQQALNVRYYQCFCTQCDEAFMLAGKLDMPYNYYNLMPLDIVEKTANEALERITILREQREGWPEHSRRERRIWQEFCQDGHGTLEFNEESDEERSKSIAQKIAEKSERLEKQRAEDMNSAGKTYSRFCAICWQENPAKRAVLVECGHVLCLRCADYSTDVTTKKMKCPLCPAITRFVPFFESVYVDEQQGKNANRVAEGQIEDTETSIPVPDEQEAQIQHEVDQPIDNHTQSSDDAIFKRPYDVSAKDDDVPPSKSMRTE